MTYPLAGYLGAQFGLPKTLLVFAAIAAFGALLAIMLWPAQDPQALPHEHPDLPDDHPHVKAHGRSGHRHVYVIDDQHRRWPSPGQGPRTAPSR